MSGLNEAEALSIGLIEAEAAASVAVAPTAAGAAGAAEAGVATTTTRSLITQIGASTRIRTRTHILTTLGLAETTCRGTRLIEAIPTHTTSSMTTATISRSTRATDTSMPPTMTTEAATTEGAAGAAAAAGARAGAATSRGLKESRGLSTRWHLPSHLMVRRERSRTIIDLLILGLHNHNL